MFDQGKKHFPYQSHFLILWETSDFCCAQIFHSSHHYLDICLCMSYFSASSVHESNPTIIPLSQRGKISLNRFQLAEMLAYTLRQIPLMRFPCPNQSVQHLLSNELCLSLLFSCYILLRMSRAFSFKRQVGRSTTCGPRPLSAGSSRSSMALSTGCSLRSISLHHF